MTMTLADTPADDVVVGPRSDRPKRRVFTAEYKASILAEYDAADRDGRGAILRREGPYSSHIAEWRKAADAGARAGLAPAAKDRRDREIEALRARAERAESELARTRAALDLVGKARALGDALRERGPSASARIQVGVRALAIAAAVSRTTAAAALWKLHDDGLLTRVGRGIGRGADVWQIDLGLGAGLRPARGRIWATRPVFRVVDGGHGAAEVYEQLASSAGKVSARALAAALGRSPTTVTVHLQELASWGLAVGGGRGGWVLGPADPDELASRLGAAELVAAQVARFRAEREAWWR